MALEIKPGGQKSKSTMNNEDGLNSKLIEWIRWSVYEMYEFHMNGRRAVDEVLVCESIQF